MISEHFPWALFDSRPQLECHSSNDRALARTSGKAPENRSRHVFFENFFHGRGTVRRNFPFRIRTKEFISALRRLQFRSIRARERRAPDNPFAASGASPAEQASMGQVRTRPQAHCSAIVGLSRKELPNNNSGRCGLFPRWQTLAAICFFSARRAWARQKSFRRMPEMRENKMREALQMSFKHPNDAVTSQRADASFLEGGGAFARSGRLFLDAGLACASAPEAPLMALYFSAHARIARARAYCPRSCRHRRLAAFPGLGRGRPCTPSLNAIARRPRF